MRALLAVVLVALGVVPPSAAADGSPSPPPAPAARAEQVIAAAKSGDASSFATWAGADDPDPWRVADEIQSRGEHAVALAFARASPRPTVAGLDAFLEARRARPPDLAGRAAVEKARTELAAGRHDAALAAASPRDEPADGLLRNDLAQYRASALLGLRRFDEASSAYRSAAEVARGLGWFGGEAVALSLAGQALLTKGDPRGALVPWREWLTLEERGGRKAVLAEALLAVGNALQDLAEFDESVPALERSIGLFRAVRDVDGEGRALLARGTLHARRGEFLQAIEMVEAARALLGPSGDASTLASIDNTLGHCYRSRGDAAAAIAAFTRAIASYERLGDDAGLASALGNLGFLHHAVGQPERAVPTLQRAIALAEKSGAQAPLASALSALAAHHRLRGEHETSLGLQRRAIALGERIGDRRLVAILLGNLGNLLLDMGDHASAIAHYERSLRMHEAMGNRGGAAWALSMLGAVNMSLGSLDLALELLGRALVIQEATGDTAAAVNTLRYLASTHSARGDHREAIAQAEHALKLAESLGLKPSIRGALGGRGLARLRGGDPEGAIVDTARALELAEEAGDRILALHLMENLALAEGAVGRFEPALQRLATAREESVRIGARDSTVRFDWVEGLVRYAAKDHRGALAAAERASTSLTRVLGGLADEEGALARGQYAEIYETGVMSALALGDVEGVARFIERGRAAGMLEALGGRGAVAALASQELRAADETARHAVKVALAAYRQAAANGQEAETAARRDALAAARTDLDRAASAVERDARVGGALGAAEIDLPTQRAVLGPSEALVGYWMTQKGGLKNRVVALVLTRAGARTVDLGPRDVVESACEAVGADAPAGSVEALRRLVVSPLGLDGTTRLLVSPDGALAEVPFALLAPGTEVAYVATASVLRRLRGGTPSAGQGVLALGNPTVRADLLPASARAAGGASGSLPAAADEARAVGDVVLLGAEATVPRLTAALAGRPRWRAVHFACHGLVDLERPGRSALALAAAPPRGAEPGGEDDGLLPARRVAGMTIPADLVVLSACETGRGKVVLAEGILGLTRAFFLAGSSRVLVSLWKVDDRATRLLMEAFYARWKQGGTGAAAALRDAQAAVRDHEEEVVDLDASRAAGRDVRVRRKPYAAPRFWAAWVLWGLPE